MKITTLTVDDGTSVASTVHANEHDAVAALKLNYCTEAPDDLDDDAVIAWATEREGLILYINEHDLPEPYVATVPTLVVVHRENPSGRVVGLECPKCGKNDIRELDRAERWNPIEAEDGALQVNQLDAEFHTIGFICPDCGAELDADDDIYELLSYC